MLNVRPTLHYVGTCAGEASVGPRNGGSGAKSERPGVLQPRDHQAALSLYRDREGIAQFFLEEGWFARVTDPAIMYSYRVGNRSRAYIRRSSCVNSREERKGSR